MRPWRRWRSTHATARRHRRRSAMFGPSMEEAMFVLEQIRTGGDRNFGYLIGDTEARQAMVVDPSYDPESLIQRAQAQQMTVTHIINTHGHTDHTNGNRTAKSLTGAEVVGHPQIARADIKVEHEQTMDLGRYQVRFLHTPGHTDDHLCVLVNDVLLTGDTLFVGKVGGTATAAQAETEYRSLHEVLLKLPGHTMVWPGHDFGCRPASTLALEQANNPFLRVESLDEFMDIKAHWARFKREKGLM
jgi:glyoxylase-like metal-dependent hydrolase (beta-lactamase superfamily II)